MYISSHVLFSSFLHILSSPAKVSFMYGSQQRYDIQEHYTIQNGSDKKKSGLAL